VYSLGAIVDYLGVIYVSLQNQNLNEEPDTSAAFWQATGQVQFLGAWSSTVTYGVGALVDYSGTIYISLQASNLNNVPSSSPTFWQSVGAANSVFIGVWNSATAYVIGNQVTFSGTSGNAYYIALANNTNKQPDTNPSDWQQIGAPNSYVFLGAYNGATAYIPGNQVSYLGSYWICISATTGNAPGVGSSFWEQIGQAAILLQSWSSSTAYTQGMEVLYLSSIYQCILANTNQQPNISPTYWTLISNPSTAVGFQMVSNPDFQNGLTNYSVYDNNSTGHITLSLASNSAAPGGFGQTLEISVAGGGENPGLGGFYYFTALDSGVVVLDKYHVGDTYIVSVWANIPVGYTINFANNSLGTGGSFTPLSSSYAGTGGWVNYVWQVIIGTSPASSNAFPFFYLTGTFSSAFNWYAAQLSITDISQPARGNQNLFLGAWSSTTPYVPGNEVSNGGNYWTCLVANTNQTPPTPPTTSSYWLNVGPVNLGNLPDGSSRFAAVGSGLSYRPTTNPLTATDAGSSATVSIASFTMQTSGNGAISVNSGSITALSYGTLYYIYYSDPTLAGGTVTFLATTSKATAIDGNGNFYVGSITTPISGGIQTTGFGDGGVGAQNGGATIYLGALATVTTVGTGGTVTNPNNAIDGNITTFADIKTNFSTSASQSAKLLITGFPPIQVLTGATLYIRSSGSCAFSGSGTTADAEVDYSLNGGGSLNLVYALNTNGSSHALDTQAISLPIGQNLALVQVEAFTDGSITISGSVTTEIKLYEAWIEVIN
jgi:hypothetical protein